MTNENVPIHYVCTHGKVKDLVDSHSKFWVSNCGRREGRGGCGLCRDVCPEECIKMVARA